jgi:hypothetical protein
MGKGHGSRRTCVVVAGGEKFERMTVVDEVETHPSRENGNGQNDGDEFLRQIFSEGGIIRCFLYVPAKPGILAFFW